jgi:hypothetical protein
LATGFKLIEVDQERQMQILAQEAEQQYRAYRAAVKTGDDVKIDAVLKDYQLK